MLLIVDDVWNAAAAAPFLKVRGRNSALLITTRLSRVAHELASSEKAIYKLPSLDEDAALLLLHQIVPSVVNQYPTECLQLVRELGTLPLALHIAGRMLREELKLGLSVIDLLEGLRQSSALFSEPAPIDRVEGTLPITISGLLRRSTDLLDKKTRERFAFLGALAPKPDTFDLDTLKALWQEKNPQDTIRILVNHGLLEPVGSGRFQMNALLVGYARSLLT
jgi:predicted metal-dependent hydrolase